MPVKVDRSGLDKLQKNLKELSRKHTLSDKDLFPDAFMRKYTDFPSFQALCEASGVNSNEEIGNDAFSKFVAEHSRFNSYEEMLKKGGAEYAGRTLTKGLKH
jgi:hypothetical protein